MTMRELAKLANVSVSTVSKAFHDAPDISAETRELVFSVAKQYGCYGKFYKGKFHKKVIALICPELKSEFYLAYVQTMKQLVERFDGITVISEDGFSDARQAELIDYYASYLQVDGVVVLQLRQPLKKGYEVPIVSILSSPDPHVDTVSVNLKTPVFEMVRELKRLGHESIAFLGERNTAYKAKLFCEAMQAEALSPELVVESSLRFEQAGADGAARLMATKKPFSAVICAYDYIAIGAIRRFKQCGLRVPADVSVLGMDNIGFAAGEEFSLSTVDTDAAEVCRIAWEILMKKQNSRHFRSTQNVTVTGRVIWRDSTCART